jgi:DNA transposition AAA+ family ATPase
MEIQELNKLRKALPKGSFKKIAEKVGLSEAGVGQVLKGKFNNTNVINEAINLLAEHKKAKKEISKRLAKLI